MTTLIFATATLNYGRTERSHTVIVLYNHDLPAVERITFAIFSFCRRLDIKIVVASPVVVVHAASSRHTP